MDFLSELRKKQYKNVGLREPSNVRKMVTHKEVNRWNCPAFHWLHPSETKKHYVNPHGIRKYRHWIGYYVKQFIESHRFIIVCTSHFHSWQTVSRHYHGKIKNGILKVWSGQSPLWQKSIEGNKHRTLKNLAYRKMKHFKPKLEPQTCKHPFNVWNMMNVSKLSTILIQRWKTTNNQEIAKSY